jgi:serine/threonine protein kinase
MTNPEPDTVLVGRYRLRSRIGEGGMGQVWLATDELLGRDVAVKMLAQALLKKQEMRERFRREANTLARLTHSRIAAVLDYAESDDSAFIVMELLVGETLSRRLARERRIPPAEAAEIAAHAADGLQAAHEAGVTHRDVKPGNIMLTATGAKVFDFGIAATAWDAGLTTTGVLVGTLAYVSPERAAGRAGTPSGDVYALGVVLYEMLAGRPPFQADNPLALVYAYANEQPAPLPPDVPERLARACLHALAKTPIRRTESAAAFAAEIRDAMAAEPAAGSGVRPDGGHPTQPQSLPPAIPSLVRDRRVLAAAAGILAVLVALVLTRPSGSAPTVAAPPTAGSGIPLPSGSPATTTESAEGGNAAAAMAALRQAFEDGASSGQIRSDVSVDLGHGLDDLQDKLDNGQRGDAISRVEDLIRRIHTRIREDGITTARATILQRNLLMVANALN